MTPSQEVIRILAGGKQEKFMIVYALPFVACVYNISDNINCNTLSKLKIKLKITFY